VVDGKKMSKSLGNFYTLRDILARGYNGREIRYQLVSTHYRQALNFTFEGLDAARSALARVDEFVARLEERLSTEEPELRLPVWAEECQTRFLDSLNDDLNISGALGALFDMIHAGNKALDENHISLEEIWGTRKLLDDWHQVLGFLRPRQKAEADEETLAIVELREKARKAKNWAESDRLREELAARGWEVKDTPQGPKLKPKGAG